jgi:hypothetical protein
MMETVRISETSVYSNETTRRYIPEGSDLNIRRRENLKSHLIYKLSLYECDIVFKGFLFLRIDDIFNGIFAVIRIFVSYTQRKM